MKLFVLYSLTRSGVQPVIFLAYITLFQASDFVTHSRQHGTISPPPLFFFSHILDIALKLISKILLCSCGIYIKRTGFYKDLMAHSINLK